jgi:imidazolonepropionase-like amidohydrolase
MRIGLTKGLGALLVALMASAAPAQTVAITGGTVALGDGSEPIQGGTVVILNGRIVAAGAGVAVPAGAQVVDATGKWVTPGIFAGFSRVGLAEVDAVGNANDVSAATSPFSAAIDVAPAVNPRAAAISISRANGVTRAVVAPATGRSIFAGQGAIIDLGSDMQPITRARAFQFVEFGETGSNEAGGSRAATFVLFRNALREARDLSRFSPGISSGGGQREPRASDQRDLPLEEVPGPNQQMLGGSVNRGDDVLLTRFDAAALVPVLTGRQPLLVHVERASDILQVLGLRREFPNLKLVLVGATEGWTVADQIRESGVPVIANALVNLPASFEQLAATQSNFGRMRAAGIKIAMGTINEDETRMIQVTRQNAGNLVALTKVPGAAGLSWGEALAAITSRPAEVMGMGGEIGSLRAGRRADVVIWSGDPLETTSTAQLVMIDGVQQPLDTRQTKLRDRYRNVGEGQLPKAYER